MMSELPSPLKSPTLTSTQLTMGLQVAQREVVGAVVPVLSETHHWPLCWARPMMSASPSPLKSPTLTSSQVTAVLQVLQSVVLKEAPVESATHHWPVCSARAAMSVLPSLLKSPLTTSTQVTPVLQVAQSALLKALLPL